MATVAETLTLARQRHQAGDLTAATQLYRLALEADPAHPEALVLLALACHQRGELGEAEAWYRRALAVRPGDAEVHFRLGMVLMGLGRPSEAADHFRQTVQLRPEAAEAWNNLGNVLFLNGKTEEAIPCYREAIRQRPGYAEAYLNLGNALREDERLSEGLACYREAVRLRPAFPKALNNLAEALLEMGEARAAEASLRESLKYRPNAAQVLNALALNGFYTHTDPGPDQLRALLADARLSPVESSYLHSTLAYLLDRAGQFDQAFDHFRQANQLRRDLARQAGNAFDPAEHSRLVDRLQAVFTPAYFERIRGMGLETDAPVFVVGMPRSGSSLVEQILSHHPDVAGVGELRDLPRLAATLPERIGTPQPYPECVSRLAAPLVGQLAEGYLTRVRSLAGSAQRVTDKMLENFLHLGLAATLFPRARVIHCQRDPLDTCVSCYLQVFRNLNFAWDLDELGRCFKGYERLMAHWRTTLPLPMLEVVYEELVADPPSVIRRLLDYCALPWDERCLRFYQNPRPVRTVSKLQVRQPIYGTSVGRWQRYAAHLAPLCRALGRTESQEQPAGPLSISQSSSENEKDERD